MYLSCLAMRKVAFVLNSVNELPDIYNSGASSPPHGGADSIFAAHTLDSGFRRNDGQEGGRIMFKL